VVPSAAPGRSSSPTNQLLECEPLAIGSSSIRPATEIELGAMTVTWFRSSLHAVLSSLSFSSRERQIDHAFCWLSGLEIDSRYSFPRDQAGVAP